MGVSQKFKGSQRCKNSSATAKRMVNHAYPSCSSCFAIKERGNLSLHLERRCRRVTVSGLVSVASETPVTVK